MSTTPRSQRFIGGRPPFPTDGTPPVQPRVLGAGGDQGTLPTSSGVNPRAFVGGVPSLRRPIYDDLNEYRPGQAGGVLRGPGGDAQLVSYFLSRFQPQQAVTWHRKVSAAGSTVIAAPGGGATLNVGRLTVDTVPKGYGLIITRWVQFWLQECDALNPTVLGSLGPYAASAGRTTHTLLVEGAPVVDAFERNYDPWGATTRQSYGYSDLDRNLLEMGPSPYVIYVRDGALLEGAWVTGSALPLLIPQVVGCEVEGFLVPNRLFYEIALHNGVPI